MTPENFQAKSFQKIYDEMTESVQQKIVEAFLRRDSLDAEIAWILFDETADVRFLLKMVTE